MLIEHPADFPPEFIKAFKSGKLVFFCGAGVSNYKDAVPEHYHSFENLTRAVLNHFDPSWEKNEQSIKYKWFKQGKYDELLEFLEKEYEDVDTFIKSLFQNSHPDLKATKHQTLVNLAKGNPSGQIRIVTTNFDTLFTQALAGDETIHEFYAPHLPLTPKEQNASFIIYLHGSVDNKKHHEWIYNSSGFGTAYITNAWATRFMMNLAQNYHICFVGYSVNDPIMVYLLHGLKKEYLVKSSFALQSGKDLQEISDNEKLLQHKGILPISFPTYDKLWQALTDWHDLPNRDIIELCQEAFQDFDESNETLTDLQRYVLQNLVPPDDLYFDDKNPLTNETYQRIQYHSNLAKYIETLPFGLLKAVHMVDCVQSRKPEDRSKQAKERTDKGFQNVDYEKIDNLPNLIRPDFNPKKRNYSAYGHFISRLEASLHPISEVWIRLIVKHINDPNVFQWLIQQGDFLHKELVSKIEWQLNHNPSLEIKPDLKKAWELLLLNQHLLPCYNQWGRLFSNDKLAKEGNSLYLQTLSKEALRPYLKFSIPQRYEGEADLFYAEICITEEDQGTFQCQLTELQSSDPQLWKELLPTLETSLQTHLELTKTIHTAKELTEEKNLTGEDLYYSHKISSVLKHEQNSEWEGITVLFGLWQRCFDQLHKTETAFCNQVLERLASKPEGVWHRMVLAYVTHYPDLDSSPAWRILKKNDFLAIKKMWGIKKEFFDCIEQAALTLPKDILQAIYAQLRLAYDENNECTWHDYKKYNVLESLKSRAELALPDDLATLYNGYTKTYSRKDESYKFSGYSTGFQWVPPPDVKDLIKSPEDDAFKYFDDLTATRDKASKFQEYVAKEPQKGFKVFSRLLAKDVQFQFSKRYLRSLDWGLSSFYREGDSSQEKTGEASEAEKQARLFPLLGIYEHLFALSTLHDPSQPLYSGASFMNDEITWLADREQPRVLALFETMWQRSKVTLEKSTLSHQNYFTQVLNQPLGKLVEGLLKLELHRARKHQQEDKPKEKKNTFTLLRETKRYLDDLIQMPNVEYTYSMLGAYLAFLFQVHQEWTEAHLIPLLETLDKKEKRKGKALLEGLVGYGHFDVPLFNALRDSLRNLDFQAYFKAEDRQLFTNYANTMLSTYFEYPDTPTGLKKMTAVDLHAWLKEMPVENLTLVAQNLDTHFVMTEDFFNRKVSPFFKVGWPKEKAKHTAEQTAAFIQLALEHPMYCQRISDVLREEGLIIRAENGHHSHFLSRITSDQLTPFDQANFTAFCNLLSDYLPCSPTQVGYILKRLKEAINKQSTLKVSPSLKNYLDRV